MKTYIEFRHDYILDPSKEFIVEKDIEIAYVRYLAGNKTLPQLEESYRTLSEVSEHFPRNSKHSASLFIEQRMVHILKAIKLIKDTQ